MFQRFKLDARKVDLKTKKAILLKDLLDDDDKEKDIQEEVTGIPQPKGEELTPVSPLPGAPKGMKGEVEEEYTPMSAAEIAEKRKEQEKAKPTPPAPPVEEGEEGEFEAPPTFRDVMKDLLKGETPEGKKEQAQQAKYGPPEKIQETVDLLKEFYGTRLMDVDVETAQAVITRADLPDILKDRAQMLFNSRSLGDLVRTEQMALNSLNVIMPKQVAETEEWLRDTPEGQEYMRKMFDKYRIGRVMSMLENTVLMMAGQPVVDQPRGPGASPEQRKEKKRLEQLGEALKEGTITDGEFDEAKRLGWSLTQLMREKGKGKAFRLNMKKKAKTFLTQKGYDTFKRLRETEGEELPELYGLLGTFKDIPSMTVQELVNELKISGQSPEAIEEMLETWRVAHEQGLLLTEEDLPVEGEEFDLPGNMPPGIANKLNMRKDAEGDVTGPGGDEWEYQWTSGPSPTKDEPQKRKHRFPFRNKPSTYTPGEGDQGNLFDVGPQGGQSDINYLANIIESMSKTADNDLFSTHSFDNGEKWLTYTLFKKAYSKFRPGDIVVQYGYTPADCQTYRRRFGSVAKAKKSLVNALSPILAAVVSKPTPDDTLHDLQKGKGEPGGAYGPRTGPYDKQPWQGNRDGFDAKQPPRQRTKRKFIPHMDTPDDEGGGFMGGRTMGKTKKEKKADFAAPVVETPEERAAVIEQPPIKPINRDPKRDRKPKKRYDFNEQNLTRNPNYMGEDSSGFDRERILLSMKKKEK